MTNPIIAGIDMEALAREGLDIKALGIVEVDASLLTPIAKVNKNENLENGFSDMTSLTRLDEKTVLNNLEKRFKRDITYTYIGSVLVSINPFQAIDGLYDNKARFHEKSLGDQAPHVYAIAEKAYASMLTSAQNQSFVISGESGAGKTETMKQILNYLSEASTRAHEGVEGHALSEIPKKVLESNPILEAFGNAKTIHNHNSSRFGKFMEIQFDSLGVMIGAKMCDYLLEKTRIVHQAETERNFHIFYQLLACEDKRILDTLQLNGTTTNGFRYLNGGGCVKLDTLDDKKEFGELQNALGRFFSPVLIEGIWKVLAAILHLGNIDFTGADSIRGVSNESTATAAASLLGLETNDLIKFLTKKITRAGNDVVESNMRRGDAVRTRDTLAKTVYQRMFKWVLHTLNGELCVEADDMAHYCGLLDIFGFEVFKVNDLEQMCINYANESLQNFFNNFVFKMEQLEYRNENVKVKAVNFTDNQDCLDMIAGPKDSIFVLCDDQCQLGSSNVDSLIHNFDEKLKRNAYYSKDKKCKNTLSVKHYAGKVTYDATLWIEKNKERTPDTLAGLVGRSQMAVVQTIFTVGAGLERKPSKSDGNNRASVMIRGRKQQSVVSAFKKSLEELMTSLKKTQPLFIRCLKPNGAQVAKVFDQNYILNQMKSVGMVDTIRIRQIGFPVRYTFPDFNEKFLNLLPNDVKAPAMKLNDSRQLSEYIMKWLAVEDDEYAMGLSKVFVKDSQADALENRLAAVQKSRMRKLRREVAKMQRAKEDANVEAGAQRRASLAKPQTQSPPTTQPTRTDDSSAPERSAATDMAKMAMGVTTARNPGAHRKGAPSPPPLGRRPSTELLDIKATSQSQTVLDAHPQAQSLAATATIPVNLLLGRHVNGTSVRRARSGGRSSPMFGTNVLRGTLMKTKQMAGSSRNNDSYLAASSKPSPKLTHSDSKGVHFAETTVVQPTSAALGTEWNDEDGEVTITKLFLTSQAHTRIVSFQGIRSATELERLFHRNFPSHTFTSPFPTLYITDPEYKVQYELTDCTQIREGSILTAHTPAVDLDVRLNELDKKLDRSLDGIKDTLRMATMASGVASSSPFASASTVTVTASDHTEGGGTGMSSSTRKRMQAEVQTLQLEASQLRREVAVAKQSTREAHESFMASLSSDLTALAQAIVADQKENSNSMALRRKQLDRAKHSLQAKCGDIGASVDAIRSTLQDMTEDVVKRKIKPSEMELNELRCGVNLLEGNVNALGKTYDDSRGGFKQLWKEELQLIVDDENLMDDIEGKVEDIENDFDELARQSDAMDQLLVLRATMPIAAPALPIGAVDEDEAEEVMDSVLDEIMYIQVDHNDRMRKVQEMEAKMMKKKIQEQNASPLAVFTMDLSKQKHVLKKTGGVEELERQRKLKAKTAGLGFGSVIEDGGC